LLAKGAAIGIQFETLFKDSLYDELAQHANAMAMKLADGIRSLGYDFFFPVETNLIIPVLPNEVAKQLHRSYGFYDWRMLGDKTAVRLLTSWATRESAVNEFIADLSSLQTPSG
jgi:threonine aldolase